MKKLMILATLLAYSSAFAADYSDKNHNIFLDSTGAVNQGTNENYIWARVALSKAIIQKDFHAPIVSIQYRRGSQGQWKVLTALAGRKDFGGQFFYFDFKFPFGATTKSGPLQVVAFVSNGVDRLFDNNFSGSEGYLELSQKNGWKAPAY